MGLNLDKSGKRLLPPTIGRIAIGRKEGNRPVKVDHFLFTKPVTASEDFAPIDNETTKVMKEKYGEKPKEIRVVLPFHHFDEVFYTSFCDWKGRTAWSCKSENGCTALRRQQNGSLVEVPCDYEHCKYRLVGNDPNKTTCRPNGILSVLLMDAPLVGGVWKFRTNAWGSVDKIQKALEMIFNVRGSLMGLEVLLSVVMESQMVPDGKGGKAKQNVPVVTVKMPCTMRELADGHGTLYGNWAEIKELARIRGSLADTAIVKELSDELTNPPSAGDETEEETSGEDSTTVQGEQETISDKPKNTETKPATSTTTELADDDLF